MRHVPWLRIAKHAVFAVFPPPVAQWIEEEYYVLFGERELSLVPLLCDPERDAIDVGANQGCYTMVMRKYARHVVAFEPNPNLSSQLAKRFQRRLKRVTVESRALSRANGKAALHVPVVDGHDVAGLATLAETPIPAAGEHEIEVPTAALDDAFKGDVGFIKIDVEGHESAVLEGAQTTIKRCRPTALVELEERHAPGAISHAQHFFSDLNYRGFFFRDGWIQPIEHFDPGTMQRSEDISRVDFLHTNNQPENYTNNFLFIPAERSDMTVCRIADALHLH